MAGRPHWTRQQRPGDAQGKGAIGTGHSSTTSGLYLENQDKSCLRLAPDCSTGASDLGISCPDRGPRGDECKARPQRGQEGAGAAPLPWGGRQRTREGSWPGSEAHEDSGTWSPERPTSADSVRAEARAQLSCYLLGDVNTAEAQAGFGNQMWVIPTP